MRSLDARVRELEERTPRDGEGMLILIRALVGAENSKLGAAREVHYDPIGLTSMSEDRHWPRKPGESVEALTERVEAELKAEGHTGYMVREMYVGDQMDAASAISGNDVAGDVHHSSSE